MQKDLRAKIPGITKYHFDSWEALGYINPKKVQKLKISRRLYSESDYILIKNMWSYYSLGFPPKIAHQKAINDMQSKQDKNELTLDDIVDLYQSNKQDLNSFFNIVFEGKELTINELLKRTGDVIKDSESNRIVQHVLQYLPVQKTSDNKYKFKGIT